MIASPGLSSGRVVLIEMFYSIVLIEILYDCIRSCIYVRRLGY